MSKIFFFQEIKKIKKNSYDSNVRYSIHGQNKQIEEFDFLIWSGLPSDLSRLTKSSKPELGFLGNQMYHHVSTSVVEMRNVVKESYVQTYARVYTIAWL